MSTPNHNAGTHRLSGGIAAEKRHLALGWRLVLSVLAAAVSGGLILRTVWASQQKKAPHRNPARRQASAEHTVRCQGVRRTRGG
jgi:hypothetical protein